MSFLGIIFGGFQEDLGVGDEDYSQEQPWRSQDGHDYPGDGTELSGSTGQWNHITVIFKGNH